MNEAGEVTPIDTTSLTLIVDEAVASQLDRLLVNVEEDPSTGSEEE